MTQVALFGTSADPPTVGHQAILQWLAARFDWVLVWASDNPFKTNQTALGHRQVMLQLLADEMSPSCQNVRVCPSLSFLYTVQSVRQAQLEWPGVGLTLVIGSDILGSLPSWYQVDELFKLVNLLIVLRPDAPIVDASLTLLEALGANFKVADFVGPLVSSTGYRQSRQPSEVIPAIADYIQRQNLYAAPAQINPVQINPAQINTEDQPRD